MRGEDKLPYEDFVPYAPETPGEQVNIHHCRSGKHNDRLYIRRNEDGSVIAYCHHCGMRGYSSPNGIRRGLLEGSLGRSRVSQRGVVGSTFQLPDDFTTDTTEWHPHSRAWVRRYGVTSDECKRNSIGFSHRLGGVVLPVFAEKGGLVAYQLRPVVQGTGGQVPDGEDDSRRRTYPKYISRRKKGRPGGVDIFVARDGGDSGTGVPDSPSCVVVTEDVLSAVKVSRVEGVVGVAIMSSSLKEKQAVKIARIAPNVAVFLDNDNQQVKDNQKKAARLLEPLVSGGVRVVKADKDPKEHSNQELEELLK